MGYKCDVCEAAEGSVYCLPDNAVMCANCDERVHAANKLSRKHERVPLTSTSSRPNCDICQDSKAVVFCTEDRALMCRGCDLMVHSANSLVGKHQRHLLTGWVVGLQPLPAPGEANGAGTTSASGSAEAGTTPPGTVPTAAAAERQQPAASTAATASVGGGPPGQNQAKAKASRSGGSGGRGAPRANGTADYEDYGALRALLGYPEALPPVAAASKPPQQQQRNGANGKAAAGPMQPPPSSRRRDPSQPSTSAAVADSQHGGGTAGGGAGPSSFRGGGGGGGSSHDNLPPGMNFPEVPNAVTLSAAELLGMPSMAGELSAKDVDAVFMPDSYTAFDDFDLDFSSLFAVPDLGPPDDDSPTLGGHGGLFNSTTFQSQPPMQNAHASAAAASFTMFNDDDDGLVPDMSMAVEPAGKRRRR